MTETDYNDRPVLAAYTAVILLLMVLYAVGISLIGPSYDRLLHEGGIVETLSAVSYFLLAGLMVLRFGRDWLARHYHLLIVVLFFGLRELDFDKKFTTMGIFKSKFFFSGEVPVPEKIIGGLIVGLLAWCFVVLIRRHLMPLVRRARRADAVSVGIWLVVALVLFSKGIDGIDRKLKGFGVHVSPLFTDNAAALEEILELAIPLIMLLAAHAYHRVSRTAAAS